MPLRVLVVDDEPTVRLTLRRAIARQSDMAVVSEAPDGATALRLVRRLSPDVVVMDVAMPGMTGLDVARRLRARGDDTPVLFFTGDHTAAERAGTIARTGVVLKAAGTFRDVLDALRQLSSMPATAATTSRAPAGFKRKASASAVASADSASPDITTIRTSRRSG